MTCAGVSYLEGKRVLCLFGAFSRGRECQAVDLFVLFCMCLLSVLMCLPVGVRCVCIFW